MLPETWQPFEVSIWSAQILQYRRTVSKHTAMSEQTGGCLIAWNSVATSNFSSTSGNGFPFSAEACTLRRRGRRKLRQCFWGRMVSVDTSHKADAAVEGSWRVRSRIFWGYYIAFFIFSEMSPDCNVTCTVTGRERGPHCCWRLAKGRTLAAVIVFLRESTKPGSSTPANRSGPAPLLLALAEHCTEITGVGSGPGMSGWVAKQINSCQKSSAMLRSM